MVKKKTEWLKSESLTDQFLLKNRPMIIESLKTKGIFIKDDFLPLKTANKIYNETLKITKLKKISQTAHKDAVKFNFSVCDLDGYFSNSDTEEDEVEVLEKDDLLWFGRLLWKLFPLYIPNFSFASYKQSDYIAEHDDLVLESLQQFDINSTLESFNATPKEIDELLLNHTKSKLVECKCGEECDCEYFDFERRLACVYYLNKDWEAKDGGEFVDSVTGETYLPVFNRFVVFMVPRMHAVAQVKGEGKDRKSIFGWWLEGLI
jgi:hypothetical protein